MTREPRNEKVSKQPIWVSILSPSEPVMGMVMKIWIFGAWLTQTETIDNHI
jgi:hypothetical protein